MSTLSVRWGHVSDKNKEHNLDYWLNFIQRATTRNEIFHILDQFRPLPWTDRERAQISQAYIKRLETLASSVRQLQSLFF